MQNLQAEGKTSVQAFTMITLSFGQVGVFCKFCCCLGAPGELALLPGVRLQEGDLRNVRPQDH